MVHELSYLHQQLKDRKKSCIDSLIGSQKLKKEGKMMEANISMMKHEILRDICSRLSQKVVIYAL